MKGIHVLAIAIVAVLVIAGTSVFFLNYTGGQADDLGVEVVDATGRTVVVKSFERIASAYNVPTAILCGLGLSSHIVGVSNDEGSYDEASSIIGIPDDDYPEAITSGLEDGSIISMGNMYNMATESIVQEGINPDLVLFTVFGFKQETGDRLTELGITYLVLFNADNVEMIYNNIELVGKITKTSDKAAELISNMRGVISKINDWCEDIVSTELNDEKYKVAPMMTSTYGVGEGFITGTFPAAISAVNVFDDIAKYAEISKETLAEKNPDVIFYTTLGMGDGVTDAAAYVASLKDDDILKNVNAVVNDRVYSVSGGAKQAMSSVHQGIVHAFALSAMFTYSDYLEFDIPTTLDSSNYFDLCDQFWEVVNS